MPGIVSIMTRHRENGPEGHLFRRPELQSDDEAGCPIELKGEETTLLLLSAGGGGGARPPRFFWGVMGAKPLCKPPPAGGFLYSKNHACQKKKLHIGRYGSYFLRPLTSPCKMRENV